MSTRLKGFLLIFTAGLCLSTSPAAIKLAINAGANPLPLLSYRLGVGCAVLIGWILATDASRLRIDRRGLLHCIAVGVFNALSLACFYVALLEVGAALAIFLFSIFPAATLLWLLVGGERISRVSVGRLIIAGLGVYLLVGPGGGFTSRGLALLAITVVFYSLHLVWVQWFLGGYASITVTFWIVATMALSSTVAALLAGSGGSLNPTGWLVVFWTGVVATAIARLAMFAGIRRIGSGQTALLGPFDTFLSVVWSTLLLGEVLDPIEWIGGLLILSSTALVLAERSRSPLNFANGSK